MQQESTTQYQAALTAFLDSYLVQRDAEKTLSLVTEDIYSLGTGAQEEARNKTEFRKLLQAELEQLPMSIAYSLHDYTEKPVGAEQFLCICGVVTHIQLAQLPQMEYNTRLTAGFRRENGVWRAYHLHMSEASSMQQEHEFFPLHYGEVAPQHIDAESQLGLVELMKKMLPGGAMGGYAEPGFPLYFINDELLHWLGYTYEEFIAENGQMMVNTMHPDDAAMVEASIAACFAQTNEYTVEYRMRKKDGTYIWVRDTGRKIHMANGRTGMISIIVDISDEKLRQQTYENAMVSMTKERRRIDRLTGLLNREPAEFLIEQHLSRREPGAFFMLDIDNFKLVNDTKGHPVGDEVLCRFAEQMKAVFSEDCVLARLGGDEFIAFVPNYQNIGQLKRLAENMLLHACGLLDDALLNGRIGVSIGIALAPGDGIHFGALYSNADKSQYYAKRNGKGRYSFYGQAPVLPACKNDLPNIDTLRRMVQNVQVDRGAFQVEYEAFNKVCQFMERNASRMKQNTQLMLFSFFASDNVCGMVLQNMEQAIRSNLRMGDLMMQFSARQIAVLLVNCDPDNAVRVGSRILEAFRLENTVPGTEVSYEIGSINEAVQL